MTDLVTHADGRDASRLLRFAQGFERREQLDRGVRLLQPLSRTVARGPLRRALAGRWLGHSLHPLLTDLPLGCWTGATVLDLTGGPGSRAASRRLIGAGLLLAVPTAAAGLSDWAHTDRESQRVGVAHAAANTTALALYAASFAARSPGRASRPGAGIALGLLGGCAATVGGFLGGHLSLARAVTRDNDLLDEGVESGDAQTSGAGAGAADVDRPPAAVGATLASGPL
jgi:uncharacterized membrane protein